MGQLVLGNEMYTCTVWVTVLTRHQMNATSYTSPRAGQGNDSYIIQRNCLQRMLKTVNPQTKSVLKPQLLPQSNSNSYVCSGTPSKAYSLSTHFRMTRL